jgi:site-specific recombinase XerD
MENIIIKENNELKELEIHGLIEKYLNYIDVSSNTERTYNVGLLQFSAYLKENNIKTPTREDVINFREELKTEHKPNTVNTYLVSVKNFYSWLEYEGIAKDITKKIKGIKLERIHLKRGLTKDEIQEVLSVCKDTREELLIKLMITCGLRINEVSNIRLSDFYKDHDVVMLKVLGKARNGLKQDSVKIDDRLFELIKKYCEEWEVKDYLFYSTSNNNTGGKLTTTSLRRIIMALFRRANLDMDMLTPHSTRHTSCEMLLDKGVPVQEVSQFLRHKSISTVMVYARELDQRKSQSANMLGDLVF